MALDLSIQQIGNFSQLQRQINELFADIAAGAVTLVPMTDGANPPSLLTDGAGGLIYTSFAP